MKVSLEDKILSLLNHVSRSDVIKGVPYFLLKIESILAGSIVYKEAFLSVSEHSNKGRRNGEPVIVKVNIPDLYAKADGVCVSLFTQSIQQLFKSKKSSVIVTSQDKRIYVADISNMETVCYDCVSKVSTIIPRIRVFTVNRDRIDLKTSQTKTVSSNDCVYYDINGIKGCATSGKAMLILPKLLSDRSANEIRKMIDDLIIEFGASYIKDLIATEIKKVEGHEAFIKEFADKYFI